MDLATLPGVPSFDARELLDGARDLLDIVEAGVRIVVGRVDEPGLGRLGVRGGRGLADVAEALAPRVLRIGVLRLGDPQVGVVRELDDVAVEVVTVLVVERDRDHTTAPLEPVPVGLVGVVHRQHPHTDVVADRAGDREGVARRSDLAHGAPRPQDLPGHRKHRRGEHEALHDLLDRQIIVARADEGELRVRTEHGLERREPVEVILVDVAVDHGRVDPAVLALEPLLQSAPEILGLVASLAEPDLGEHLDVFEGRSRHERRLEQMVAKVDHPRTRVEDDELVGELERQACRVPADPDVAGREGSADPPELHDDGKEQIAMGHVCHDGLP